MSKIRLYNRIPRYIRITALCIIVITLLSTALLTATWYCDRLRVNKVIDEIGGGVAYRPMGTDMVRRITGRYQPAILLRARAYSNINIDDRGVELLAELLPNLEQLNLSESDITDDAFSSISKMNKLSWLSAKRVRINGDGLELLRPLDNLQVLILDNTQIDDSSVVNLKYITTLTTLSLSGTPITDNAIDTLLELDNLKILILVDTHITPAGIEYIRESKPDMAILY